MSAPAVAAQGRVAKMGAEVSRVRAPGAENQVAQDSTVSGAEAQRFIALRHELTLETPANKLKAVYETLVKRCAPGDCELLGANYSRETEGMQPAASLEMRIAPKAAEGFIASLGQEAEVLAHNRSSQDRTDQVVDVEAQLKNLTQLRDQLRAMLAQRQGSLKDTLEVQRELANTQSRLDSMTGARKTLANETEKVAVAISLIAKRDPVSRQVLSPLKDAWNSVGEVMSSSLAYIITFIAAVLPWLLIGLPLLWVARWFWKRRRSTP